MRNRSIVGHPRHPHVFYTALAEFQKEQERVCMYFFGPPLTCDLSNEYDLPEPFTETNDLVMDLAISVISQAREDAFPQCPLYFVLLRGGQID